MVNSKNKYTMYFKILCLKTENLSKLHLIKHNTSGTP